MTCDRWREVNILKNFISLALTAWEGRFVEYLEEKADGLSDGINHKGVCRTAPATPGLLKMGNPMLPPFLHPTSESEISEISHYNQGPPPSSIHRLRDCT